MVYPLYYKYSQGNIPDNILKCEEISHRSGLAVQGKKKLHERKTLITMADRYSDNVPAID